MERVICHQIPIQTLTTLLTSQDGVKTITRSGTLGSPLESFKEEKTADSKLITIMNPWKSQKMQSLLQLARMTSFYTCLTLGSTASEAKMKIPIAQYRMFLNDRGKCRIDSLRQTISVVTKL